MYFKIFTFATLLLFSHNLLCTASPVETDTTAQNHRERQILDITTKNLCAPITDPKICMLSTFQHGNVVDLFAFDNDCKVIGSADGIAASSIYNFKTSLPEPIVMNGDSGLKYGGTPHNSSTCYDNSLADGTKGHICQFIFPCSPDTGSVNHTHGLEILKPELRRMISPRARKAAQKLHPAPIVDCDIDYCTNYGYQGPWTSKLDVTTINLCTPSNDVGICLLSTFTAWHPEQPPTDVFIFDNACNLIGNLVGKRPWYLQEMNSKLNYPLMLNPFTTHYGFSFNYDGLLYWENDDCFHNYLIDGNIGLGRDGLSCRIPFPCKWPAEPDDHHELLVSNSKVAASKTPIEIQMGTLTALPEHLPGIKAVAAQSKTSSPSYDTTLLNLCQNNYQSSCMLATFANKNGMDLFIFDFGCNLIGFKEGVPYGSTADFASQLPNVLVMTADEKSPSFTYQETIYYGDGGFQNYLEDGTPGWSFQMGFECWTY